MITLYRGKETGPSAGMILMAHELRQIDDQELRKDCYEKNGRFHSVIKWKGNKINLGVFPTAKQCNSVWDRSLARRKILARTKSPVGHTKATVGDGRRVNVMIKGAYTYIGTFDSPRLAKEAYGKAFDDETARLLSEFDKSN